jgi:hypothetical protein
LNTQYIFDKQFATTINKEYWWWTNYLVDAMFTLFASPLIKIFDLLTILYFHRLKWKYNTTIQFSKCLIATRGLKQYAFLHKMYARDSYFLTLCDCNHITTARESDLISLNSLCINWNGKSSESSKYIVTMFVVLGNKKTATAAVRAIIKALVT